MTFSDVSIDTGCSNEASRAVFDQSTNLRGGFLCQAPRLTVGDVVSLVQPETYMRTKNTLYRHACRHASYAVLAATARLGGSEGALSEERFWRADGENVLKFGGLRGRAPVPLLPIGIAIVERYREQRCEDREPWLFVTDNGKRCDITQLRNPFYILGKSLGFPGWGLTTRLNEFFDRCFDRESDRAAVVALRGMREAAIDAGVLDDAIAEAAADPVRLRRVLERNHPLAGPAGRYMGERSRKFVAACPQNLPPPRPRIISAAMDSDPIIRALRQEKWPESGQKGFVKHMTRLRDVYFDHVAMLWRAGELMLREVCFLFRCSKRTVHRWRSQRELRAKTEEDHLEEVRLRERVIAAFRRRPAGQKLNEFRSCFTIATGCKRERMWMVSTLLHAGEIPRRRGRPRKRGAGAVRRRN